MTAVSAWAKPGTWALDSEEHEEEEVNNNSNEALSDFPSLSAAAAVVTKAKKKKNKPQTLSLSEFNTGKFVSHGSKPAAKVLTHSELLALPTGPRERSAEELERSSSSRLGGAFRSYGDNTSARSTNSYSSYQDSSSSSSSSSRWGSREDPSSARKTSRHEFTPSKADEVDDWGAAKKSPPPLFERRDRGGPTTTAAGAGFFDSQSSRADESASWLSKKTSLPSSEPRRMGFDRDRRVGVGGFERDTPNGAPTWGKRGGEEGSDNGGRPRLVLQPRTLSVSNGEHPGSASSTLTKTNPFGDARPREQVLAAKGQDWKKIDEQLDSIKIKEMTSHGNDFGKKVSGNGNGYRAHSPDGSWRKTDSDVHSPIPSEEKAEKDGESVTAET